MDEERQRKVEAGKERLNSYRKKKTAQQSGNDRKIKKPRKNFENEKPDSNDDTTKTLALEASALANSDISVDKTENENVLPIKENSSEDLTNGTQVDDRIHLKIPSFDENGEPSSLSLTQFNLSDIGSHFEIEMTDSFIPTDDGFITIKESEIKSKVDEYNKKLQEFQNALQHRSEIISELSNSLKRTIEHRDKLALEINSRDEALESEFNVLKQQLHQATELLRNQKGKNNSAHELFEARSQLLELEEQNKRKDKTIQELTQQVYDWRNACSNIRNELALEKENNKKINTEQEKLNHELNHRFEEFSRMQTLFHEKLNEKDKTLGLCKSQLAAAKTNEETLTKQMEVVKAAIRTELDEQYGLHINEMKSQIQQQHESTVVQLNVELSNKVMEMESMQQTLSAHVKQIEELKSLVNSTSQSNISCDKQIAHDVEALGQCVIGGDTSVNLDQMMFEILQLKNENERLKIALLDGNNEEGLLWRGKYEEIVKEKLEIEMELKSLRCLGGNQSNPTCKVDNKRVELLEEELEKTSSAYKLKLESVQAEKSALNEKYMNQMNELKKTKLDLELKVCELESRHQSMLKSEQEIKNELLKVGQEKFVFPDEILSALKLERSDFSGVNFLVEQITATENNLTVLKFRLLEEEEIKSALNNKIAHLTKCCETYELRQNQLKNEVDTLQNQLQIAWHQHENTIVEMERIKREKINDESMERVGNNWDEERQIGHLQGELREMEEKFGEENRVLKKCLEEERAKYENIVSQLEGRLDWNEKMQILMDSNRDLLEEREEMLSQMRNEEEILTHLQSQLSNVDSQGSFVEQLTVLNGQQKALLEKMESQNEKRLRLFDVLNERNIFEETLRRDKEMLKQKMEEKEQVESQLIHQKVELERLRFEKRHLEELLLHKDQMEKELKRQRRSLEDDLAELEHQLRDREDVIRREKQQLQMEMQKKELALRKWQTDLKAKEVEFYCLHSSLQAKEDDQNLRLRMKLQRDSLQKIEEMRALMNSQHSIALGRLRKELEQEFAVREGRLVANHAAQVTGLQYQNTQQLKLMGKMDELPEGWEKSCLIEELTRAKNAAEQELLEDVDRNEKRCLEEVHRIVEKLSPREIQIVCREINNEVAKRQQHFELIAQNEMKTISLQSEHVKLNELCQLREELNKSHKNEVNQITQNFQTQINLLQKEHSEQIAKLIGEEKVSCKTLMNQLQIQVVKEYQQCVQNLSEQWESEYLQRLADLRNEIEAKFKEATTFCKEKNKQGDDSAVHTNETSFSHVEKMLDEREELINRVTELRRNLEKVQMAETEVLKETLKTEFTAVIEIQTEMRKVLEANDSPVLIELKKIKEEYEKLQEKYEEIVKEEINVTEEPIEGVEGEKIVYKKTTPVAGGGEISEQLSYEETREEKSEDKKMLEDELRKLQEKLEEKHIKDMEDLREYFEKRCQDMEVKYEDEVSRLRANQETGDESKEFLLRMPTLTHFCDTPHALEPNVMELEEHYRTELDEKLQQYRLQLEEVRRQLETKHELEIENLRKEAEVNVGRERENVEMELVEKYTQEIEDIMARHEGEMATIKNNYVQELAKETTRVRVECSEQLAKELDVESGKIEKQVEEEYLKRMDTLRQQMKMEHEKQLEIVHVRLQAEKAQEINQAVTRLQATLQKERELLLEGDTSDSSLKAKYEMQLEEAKRQRNDVCDKMEKQMENMRKEKEQVEERHTNQIEVWKAEKLSILESHKVALANCEREHGVVIETLREQCQEEMKELSVKCDDKIAELEKSWKEQVEKMVKEKKKLVREHGEELDRLKDRYDKELSEEKEKWQEEITVDNVGKFEEIAQQLDSDHQMELEMRQNLIREHEEKIEQLQHVLTVKEKEFEVSIRELKESHEKDVQELMDQHKRRLTTELKKVKQEMENASEEKLQAIALDTEALKTELEDVHRKEIIDLQRKMSKKHQDEMEVEVKKIISDMEKQKEMLKRKLEDEAEKKLKMVRDEAEENCKLEFVKLREEWEIEKENELKALRNHFDEELARVTSQLTNTNGFKEPEEEQPGDTLELQPVDVINRRVRENEETDNLIALLRERVEKLEVERDDLEQKFQAAKNILCDVVQTYSKIERIINRQLSAIANADVTDQESPTKESQVDEGEEQATVDTSMLSFLSEDGFELDLSVRISEMAAAESGIDAFNDEVVASIGTNLQLAVTRLLQILTMTVHQCHESKLAQMELINTATAHGEEAATLSARCADLQIQLTAEIEHRERLALEIHKTIGVIESLRKEKDSLQVELNKEEKARENVVNELQQAQIRINEMEERIAEENTRFNHQRTLISEGLSSHEQGILEENAQLHKNHNNLQLQSEKERHNLNKRIRELEQAFEEQVTQSEQHLESQRQQIEDLQQQVEALENKQRADKKYFEAQAGEFEQEREELQRHLNSLQNTLREKDKQRGSEDRLSHELESLTSQLLDTTQTHEETLQKKAQIEAEFGKLSDQMKDWQEIVKNLETQVEEKNKIERDLNEQVKNLQNMLKQSSHREEELVSELEIFRSASTTDELSVHVQFLEDQLESRSRELEKYRSSQSFIQELRGQIRNLEEKVERKTRELQSIQYSASSMSSPSSEELSLRDQLEALRSMQADDINRSSSPSYFDDMRRLEEKLEALSKAEEAAIKKTRDLEMTLKKQKQIEEELVQDKEALQQQVNSQLLQISALQARIEEWRHNIDNTLAFERIARLEEGVERDRELLERKEKEIEELNEQLEQVQNQLVARENEIVQLKLTPKIADSQWNILREENNCLKQELMTLQEQFSSISMPAFAQTLLDEKNQEIDHLTQELEELQTTLDEVRCKESGDCVSVETEQMMQKMLNTQDRIIRNVNELQELYSIIKVSQVKPYKSPFKYGQKEESARSALDKKIRDTEEKLHRVELLLKASQEEIDALQRTNKDQEKNLIDKETEVKRSLELADQRKREVDSLRGVLKEKETLLEQVETLQGEVAHLTDFQTKLQEDYDAVQSMLEETQKDLIKLQADMKMHSDSHQMEKGKLLSEVDELKYELNLKEKEITGLKERIDLIAKNSAIRQNELVREMEILKEKMSESVEFARHQAEDSNQTYNLSEKTPENTGKLLDSTYTVEEDKSVESRVYKNVNGDIEAQLEALEKRDKEIEKLGREKEELNEKLQALLFKNDELCKKYQKAAHSKTTITRGSAKTAPSSGEVKKLHLMIQEMKQQIEDQKKESEKNAQELKRARKHQSVVECELAEIPKLKSQLEQSREFLETKSVELKDLENVNLKLQSDLEQMVRLENNSNEKQVELQKSHETLITANEELASSLRSKEELIKNLEAKIERLEETDTDKDWRQELETTRNELEQMSEELTNTKEHHHILEAKSLMQMSEIERLKDETEQYQESMETLHSLLKMEKEEVERLKEQHKQQVNQLRNEMSVQLRKNSQIVQLEDSPVEFSVPEEMQSLIQKVHKEGVQVLSLSELLLLKSFNSRSPEQNSDAWTLHHAWENEKQQLLAEIVALKDLLMQATEATASLRTTGQATAELSNLLLQSVSTVFQKEKETMVAELRTHLLGNNQSNSNDIERLEQRINEMSENQKQVMTKMQKLFNDPESLVHQDNVKQLNKERLHHLKEKEKLLKQITKLEEDLSQRERHLKKHIDLSEYHVKQKEMLVEELRLSLEMEKKRTLDLSSQLSYEKGNNADLDTALTITKSEFNKLQAMNDRDKREIQSLTAACESEKFRSQALLQALECEQSNFSQLQEAMEAEKRRCKSLIDRHQQIIQELQKSLEVAKDSQVKAMAALKQESLNHSKARQQLEQIQNKRSGISREPVDESQIAFDHSANLTAALEREQRRVIELNNRLCQERATSSADLEREQASVHQLNKKLDHALEQNQELKRNFQRERERVAFMETETLQLRNQHMTDREREMQRESEWESKRQLERERQREEELKHEQERQRQRDLELQIQQLHQRVQNSDREIEHAKEREKQLRKDLESEQQKTSFSFLAKGFESVNADSYNYRQPQDTHLIESAKQQFQCFLFQCQQDLDSFIQQLGAGDSIVQNVVLILKTFLRNIGQIRTEFSPAPGSGDENRLQQFLEQVLHQNAELVGFVIQLCEDKMELRRTQMALEEEIVKIRQKLMIAEQSLCRPTGVTDSALSVERMSWAQERAALQLALHKAEAEVIQLKSAFHFPSSLNGSREDLSTRSDQQKLHEKVSRLHVRYLRAESFRKALVYQKKYLLVVLGGFQETEDATLAMISQIGVPGMGSTNQYLESRMPRRQFALMKFRSAARVIVAICRMKYLVYRWRPHTRDVNSSRPPSVSSPDEHIRIHRLGATPPVRDLRGRSSHSDRSNSSAKRSLAASISASAGDNRDPNAVMQIRCDRSLQKYLDRLETIQHNLAVSSTYRSPTNSIGDAN